MRTLSTLTAGTAVLMLAGMAHAGGNYFYDDGVSDNSVGLTAGGEIAVIQSFATVVGQENIQSISMTWGSPSGGGLSGLIGGETFDVYLYSDDEGDGDPRNGGFTLLSTTSSAVAAGSIDTDVFQTVAITPTVVPGTGFFIGYSINQAAGVFPTSLDQSVSSNLRAYVSGDSAADGWDPTSMGGDVGLFDMDEIGLGGVWMLRADGTGIPAPGALALLGVAGLCGRRRRR